MHSLSQLESRARRHPNSSEIKQALADAYAREKRWEAAAKVYQSLAALYPDTAALFINRTWLGASALMISAEIIFIAILLQPSVSTSNLTAFAAAIRSPAYLGARLLFMVAVALYSCSEISIYKLLSYTRDHHPAFWAMVISVLGVGLSMPAFGIRSFVFPIIGNMFLHGRIDVMEIYFSLNGFPFNLYLGAGGYLLVLGIAIFGWVVWRNQGLSFLSIMVFLAGWLGFVTTGDSLQHVHHIIFGALIAVGSVGLGLSLWNQASTQFDPAMDRSARA